MSEDPAWAHCRGSSIESPKLKSDAVDRAIDDLLQAQSDRLDTHTEAELEAWVSGWIESRQGLGVLDAEAADRARWRARQARKGSSSSLNGDRSCSIDTHLLERSLSVRDSSRHIRASLEKKEVCQAIVEQLGIALEADCAGLILYDLEAKTLGVVSAYYKAAADAPEAPVGLTLRLGEGSDRATCWHDRSPWMVRDVDTAELSDVERLLLQAAGVHSTLMVPIVYQNELLGVAYTSQLHSCRLWGTDEIGLAEAIAAEAGEALHHAHLYREAKRRAERERVFAQMLDRLRTSLDLDTTIAGALQELLDLVEADWTAFAVPMNLETARLRVSHRASKIEDTEFPLDDDFLPTVGEFVDLQEYDRTLWRRLLARETVVVENAQTADLDDRLRQTCENRIVEAFVVAPVWDRDTLLGYLCVAKHDAYTWPGDDVTAIEAVAGQMAVAVTQAQLYQRTEAQAREARSQAERLAKALEEKERLIDSLHSTQAQLVHSEKMSALGQIVAGVAHEINNPINFIYANIPYINDYGDDLLQLIHLYQATFADRPSEVVDFEQQIDLEFIRSDLKEILKSLRNGTERVRSIVATLKNFARLDEAERKRVDVREGIDSTLILLDYRLHNIEVVRDDGDLPDIDCYPGQLNQVFMNLISNAIDAIASGSRPGKIWIRTRLVEEKAARSVLICIRDNGVGIPVKQQAKIFDPFFTTKAIGSGTGLGLSVAYHIVVEQHGGRLWLESKRDRGAEFFIELPILLPKT